MVKLLASYGQWMLENTSLPKLFINATSGSILIGKAREFCQIWPNQREVSVDWTRFVRKDSPDEIGSAIAEGLIVFREQQSILNEYLKNGCASVYGC